MSYKAPATQCRRDKHLGVDTAEDVGGMARFHIVKLSEREIGISNWHLNREVVRHRRAYMTEMFPTFYGIPYLLVGQMYLQRYPYLTASSIHASRSLA